MREIEMLKITFTGDIMCEKPVLNREPEQTHFDRFFSDVEPILRQSDFVIGNLETVIAGASLGYTREMYSFNTPEHFLRTLKQLPIHLVTTANNHALDRGKEGLVSTLAALDRAGLDHTGTQLTEPAIKISNVGGVKIAVIAATASINFRDHGFKLPTSDEHMINLLCPQNFSVPGTKQPRLKRLMNKFLVGLLGQEGLMIVKKRLGRLHNVPSEDGLPLDRLPELEPYAKKIKKMLEAAKQEADLVFVCPHMGGQFNAEPGPFAKWYMAFFASCGVDLVVANHPHIIQKMEFQGETPFFYSLGNFSLSPRSTYIISDYLPEIGLLLHVYINKKDKKIVHMTLTPLIMKHDKLGFRVERLLTENTVAEEEKRILQWLEGRLNVDLSAFADNELLIKAKTD